jgi:parvulin-like peptidyl-prolyl isomerase
VKEIKIDRSTMSLTALALVVLGGCSMSVPGSLNSGLQSSKQSQENLAAIDKARKEGLFGKANDTFTICSVNDVPIMVGDYKRQLRAQEQQIQADLTVNPEYKTRLVQIADKQKISLSPKEKQDLLDKSHALQKAGQKSFDKFLKDNNATQADFDAQVLEVGVAAKAAKVMISDNLMRELVNRELLCEGAKANGLTKQAYSKYSEIKDSAKLQQLSQASGLTPDEVRKELLKNELCNSMISKLQSESPVTEDDIKQFYQDNKAQLKHGPRIRLSQILIKAPLEDRGPVESLRTQLHKSHPKWSDKDLDREVKPAIASQKQKAMNILVEAKKGADFAQLADANSQDLPARAAKNGGDLGFQEESRLQQAFLTKITGLQEGQVAPELIQSPLGFHIMKLTGKEGPGIISYEESKDQIKQLLEGQKPRQAVEKWLAEKRQAAKITMSPELSDLVSHAKEASNPAGTATR